jgi:hypothetical protein
MSTPSTPMPHVYTTDKKYANLLAVVESAGITLRRRAETPTQQIRQLAEQAGEKSTMRQLLKMPKPGERPGSSAAERKVPINGTTDRPLILSCRCRNETSQPKPINRR